jgi:TonB family protein
MRKYSILIPIAICAALMSCHGGSKSIKPNQEIITKDPYSSDSLGIPPRDTFAEVDVEPEMIFSQKPDYPEKAKQNKIETRVLLQIFIDTTGSVRRVAVALCKKPGWGFEDAAVASAYNCRFRPAQFKGKPVGVWVAYDVDFSLDEK